MKKPSDVGADFDAYAKRWRKEKYDLEVGYASDRIVVDRGRSDLVQRPGDEWGDVAPLRQAYTDLIRSFGPASGSVNVVEIGAGGGRSTAVMLDVLGDRAGDFHVVDVSPVFIEVLRERIKPPPTVHIVDDVDLSTLPRDHFDVCLAESSWSHINLYDQYRYLRALRTVLRPGGVVYVSGHFLLGVGNDWTWNRFVRRVQQIEEGVQGVFHEFTSIAALAEMLTRLGYEIGCINSNGFVARRGAQVEQRADVALTGPITFPFNPSPYDYLATGKAENWTLPRAPGRAASTSSTSQRSRLRQLAKQVPGLRPLVIRAREIRGTKD